MTVYLLEDDQLPVFGQPLRLSRLPVEAKVVQGGTVGLVGASLVPQFLDPLAKLLVCLFADAKLPVCSLECFQLAKKEGKSNVRAVCAR